MPQYDALPAGLHQVVDTVRCHTVKQQILVEEPRCMHMCHVLQRSSGRFYVFICSI